MRMRKLKWAADFIANSEVNVHNPEAYQGKWRELLNRDCIHVEIGTGKGDYWIGMANLYPELGWIGIEKQESVAALALRKKDTLEQQTRFIHGDAANIDQWFAKKEIDVIHLNFSDPWPKNRNKKRRLSNERFLDKYNQILSDDGQIIMKTDNRSLFEYSIIEFQNFGFKLEEIYLDFRSEQHDEDIISEYERKFMEKGPIYRAVWVKGGK
ncbi:MULTISPECIES: tRNA (guanosine(46)-N7)-methyltransferase TrmB [unclassified Breznakia]|nr:MULTISPECIES: tRNA (guanosine(46)-N7)-methyltransferase TrmB [unclassified Breznakia]MDH6366315.1 tRNA (guanine-N7-)-methyltransferase [Breznakia sp. PH1-1]MDH6403408.1 tRNA (guanine-N7-)-methyltransferase [Breznakia sp. PF1-11]MDH6411117.1 tRNA (guanine-N7-)-methyltransferase [Breznakia sp. PFB1-11]MDH6413620.1 tRNA (guanine-N7-)-methyltransferase [Breznakia sp. PFB1-14]MDH6415662.1 tRNA (guanine-N7-)-methyltransferase [Breznakia sp. PFB1-4]